MAPRPYLLATRPAVGIRCKWSHGARERCYDHPFPHAQIQRERASAEGVHRSNKAQLAQAPHLGATFRDALLAEDDNPRAEGVLLLESCAMACARRAVVLFLLRICLSSPRIALRVVDISMGIIFLMRGLIKPVAAGKGGHRRHACRASRAGDPQNRSGDYVTAD